MYDYASLEIKFDAFLGLLQGILAESEVEECLLFLNAGEYGVAFETLCAILEEKSIPLGAFHLIRELGEQMLIDRGAWEHLESLALKQPDTYSGFGRDSFHTVGFRDGVNLTDHLQIDAQRGVMMALIHRGFLLDASGFQEQVSPILTSLDAGDTRPLFEQAVKVVEQMSPDQWPLRLAGDNLVDVCKSERVGLLGIESVEDYLKDAEGIPPSKLGYWLLLIFSTFLRRCPGIGYDYSILKDVLAMLGWRREENQLLFEGAPTFVLLKPNEAPIKPSKTDTWHYWHWMRPRNSYAEGWLSQERKSMLHHQLLLEENPIRMFDPRRFRSYEEGFQISTREEQLDYLGRLHKAYERALVMLEAAQKARKELYVTLAYE